jgi:hypothetical protein
LLTSIIPSALSRLRLIFTGGSLIMRYGGLLTGVKGFLVRLERRLSAKNDFRFSVPGLTMLAETKL